MVIRLPTLLTCHSGPKKYLESGTSSKVGPERLCKLVHYGIECVPYYRITRRKINAA